MGEKDWKRSFHCSGIGLKSGSFHGVEQRSDDLVVEWDLFRLRNYPHSGEGLRDGSHGGPFILGVGRLTVDEPIAKFEGEFLSNRPSGRGQRESTIHCVEL